MRSRGWVSVGSRWTSTGPFCGCAERRKAPRAASTPITRRTRPTTRSWRTWPRPGICFACGIALATSTTRTTPWASCARCWTTCAPASGAVSAWSCVPMAPSSTPRSWRSSTRRRWVTRSPCRSGSGSACANRWPDARAGPA